MRRYLIILALCLLPLNIACAETSRYVVQKGDTLYRIAAQHNVSVESIKNTNGLRSNTIYIGQQLIIPNASTPTTSAPNTTTIHITQAVDTLLRLSRRYGVGVDDLRAANGLVANTIFVGQTLTIHHISTSSPSIFINLSGRNQSLPLDCESRSAVDWARHFGVVIDELEFFKRLPISDDPDVGFVGNVYGRWGQTPPNPYGVHAEPIAALLQHYKINAVAKRGMTLDELRAELNANRPVIVWVIGSVVSGRSFNYTASNGHTTLVAPYEHTVIAIGYTSTSFTFLDGGKVYSRSINAFQSSWSPLGNMAIIKQ